MKLIQCRFSSGQRVPLLVQAGYRPDRTRYAVDPRVVERPRSAVSDH